MLDWQFRITVPAFWASCMTDIYMVYLCARYGVSPKRTGVSGSQPQAESCAVVALGAGTRVTQKIIEAMQGREQLIYVQTEPGSLTKEDTAYALWALQVIRGARTNSVI